MSTDYEKRERKARVTIVALMLEKHLWGDNAGSPASYEELAEMIVAKLEALDDD